MLFPKLVQWKKRLLICCGLFVLVVSKETTTSSHAQPLVSPSGQIVFNSDRDWNRQVQTEKENRGLYSMSGEGQRQTRLSSAIALEGVPRLSRDGTRLVFTSERGSDSPPHVYKWNLSTPFLTAQRITSLDTFETGATFNPRDRSIAFTLESGEDGIKYLCLINEDGTGFKKLTQIPYYDKPSFNPDGSKLLFTAGLPLELKRIGSGLWTIHADGTLRTFLREGSSGSYSPDESRIVFVVSGRSSSGRIHIMNSDGSNAKPLSRQGAQDDGPVFSPDGQHIAFSSNSSRRTARAVFASRILGQESYGDIYIMRSDGTDVHRLTFDLGDSINPTWSISPEIPYVAPAIDLPDPTMTVSPVRNPLVTRLPAFAPGELIYAYNDLKTAPYPSFIGAQTDGKTQNFRLQGPNLEGTDGDFAFDPQLLPGGNDTLIKLGDPMVRERNPYNSYRLWQWNRQTNALTAAAPRELFFRQVSPSPDGKRIAYIAGGNALGQTPEENGGIGEPLQLFIYNPQTKKETLVSDNAGVRGGFAWLDAQTLLYTAVPAPEKTKLNPRAFARPAIYAFDVATAKSTLVLNEARHPMPSPDGSRIAFWGLRENEEALPLPANWWQTTGYTHLSVARRNGSERKSLGRRYGNYPSLVWAPDSERMLFISRRPSASKTGGYVEEWNVATGNSRQIVTLDAKDEQEVERAWFQPQFRALDVAPDGKTLFVNIEEVKSDGSTVQRVQAIDLATKQVSPVAQLRDVAGFDWRATKN